MNNLEICRKCRNNCCELIIPFTEYTNPSLTDEMLAQFPFFIFQGFEDVPYLGRNIRRYLCTRWDQKTHACAHYNTEPRPLFCQAIGTKVYPDDNCRLYDILHPGEKRPPSIFDLFKQRPV